MTSRTDSRIRSTPSPARNASSSSDATDWDNAIGGNLLGEYLAVHTENPADGALNRGDSPNPETPPRQGTHTQTGATVMNSLFGESNRESVVTHFVTQVTEAEESDQQNP